MMKKILVALSLFVLISPWTGYAAEPTLGETAVTECRFESDLKAKADMEDSPDSSTKESKGDKKSVNGI